MRKRAETETSAETMARFWSKVKIGDGCWLWTASTIRGYGQFRRARVNGSQPPPSYAHRFAWELTHGPIPDGQNVCHKCDTPLCVNPGHLFLGTQQENLDDARKKGRLVDGRGARKLSNADYIAILTAPRHKGNGKRLAAWFGVSKMTISRIWNGHFVHGPAMPEHGVDQDTSVETQAHLRAAHELHQNLDLNRVPFRLLPVRGEIEFGVRSVRRSSVTGGSQ